jgi:hypothetical protein
VNRLLHLNADWMCNKNRGLSALRNVVLCADLPADLPACSMFRLDVFFIYLPWETSVYLRSNTQCCMQICTQICMRF